MKKAAIIGHFGFGYSYFDGQTVKTKILAAELQRRFGCDAVSLYDTHGGIRAMPKILTAVLSALKGHENVIILPAHNGLRIIAPWLAFWNRVFKRNIHYSVVGGWLPSVLKRKKRLARSLRRFSGIYVETRTMKRALLEMGFSNVDVMPNCKELEILPCSELSVASDLPYRLCMFSRVMKEKGVEDAIAAIGCLNAREGREIYSLDIYGPVDSGQTDWFETLQKNFPQWVQYRGVVPFDESVETLRRYDALLFPTRFYTEGVPGTIIDAYAAGVPVVSSKWESFGDVVEDGVTGFGYDFGSVEDLTRCLDTIWKENVLTLEIKENCLARAADFLPASTVEVLVKNM